LLLAHRIGGGVGGFPDHRKVLASAARALGGNVPARYGGWLLCQFVQKQDVSLHDNWAAISNSRDSVTFAEPDARQAYPDLDGRYRWNRNSVFVGMALCPKAIC
jgi:hypothetical protein